MGHLMCMFMACMNIIRLSVSMIMLSEVFGYWPPPLLWLILTLNMSKNHRHVTAFLLSSLIYPQTLLHALNANLSYQSWSTKVALSLYHSVYIPIGLVIASFLCICIFFGLRQKEGENDL